MLVDQVGGFDLRDTITINSVVRQIFQRLQSHLLNFYKFREQKCPCSSTWHTIGKKIVEGLETNIKLSKWRLG